MGDDAGVLTAAGKRKRAGPPINFKWTPPHTVTLLLSTIPNIQLSYCLSVVLWAEDQALSTWTFEDIRDPKSGNPAAPLLPLPQTYGVATVTMFYKKPLPSTPGTLF